MFSVTHRSESCKAPNPFECIDVSLVPRSSSSVWQRSELTRSNSSSGFSFPSLSSVDVPHSVSVRHSGTLIFAGVLSKFVNLGKGWRPRLFVLEAGVLSYYKFRGPSSVDVTALFKSLRERGQLQLVGVHTHKLNDEVVIRRRHGSPHVQPQGELHLQVTTIRAGSIDNKRIELDSGTRAIHVRAETREDRDAWLYALRGAKGAIEPLASLTSTSSMNSISVKANQSVLSLVQSITDKLQAEGVRREVVAAVNDVFLQQHKFYHEGLVAEVCKRKAVWERLKQLQNEKRELETSVAAMGNMGRSTSESLLDMDASDNEQDNDEAHCRRDDEEFYDCSSVADEDELVGQMSRAQSMERMLPPLPVELPRLMRSVSEGPRGAMAGELGAEPSGRKLQRFSTLGHQHADTALPTWALAEPQWTPRDRLPCPEEEEKAVKLWTLIRECVGKDLSRICLPVYFNEPLSALQKCCEELEYSALLDLAAECEPRSAERLLHVAAFAVSSYSSTTGRTAKPFNPLLGETFELVCPERRLRFLAEKVMHHPTVVAMHAEGFRWRLDADADMRSKFWGRSIEVTPVGCMMVRFDDGDEYVWNKVTSSINNIVLGRIYVDHNGLMKVRNCGTGMEARVVFKEAGMFDRSPCHDVEGHVEHRGQRVPGMALTGTWDGQLVLTVDHRERCLWRKAPPAANPTRYNLTRFALMLNQLPEELLGCLAPTDSRLRPDQRHLEDGRYTLANLEKQRLEEKQRAARRAADLGEAIEPRWFKREPGATCGEQLMYRFTGEYWAAREEGHYPDTRDIFG